jgi:hypothetical protein
MPHCQNTASPKGDVCAHLGWDAAHVEAGASQAATHAQHAQSKLLLLKLMVLLLHGNLSEQLRMPNC